MNSHRYPKQHRRTGTGDATHEEAPRGQHVKHADRLTPVVRPRGEGGKHHEDDSRDEQRVGARPVVGKPPERELADDGAGKGDVADVLFGVGVLVEIAILQAKHGGDGSDDLARRLAKKTKLF